MIKETRAFDKTTINERKVSKHINIVGHYDDHTLIDKSGKLVQIIRMSGLDFITKDDATLDNYKNRRNSLLKTFSSEYALYFWMVRRKSSEFPQGNFLEGFAHAVNEKYKLKIQSSEIYRNTLYMAVITKPPEGVFNKGLAFLKAMSYLVDKEAKQLYLKQRHKELNEVMQKIMSALSVYQPTLLGCYKKSGVSFSQPLEFLTELINFDRHSIPLRIADVSQFLMRKRTFFNRRTGMLETRDSDGNKKFAAMLSIKDYAPGTYQSMLDQISALKIEYVITQTFRFLDKYHAKQKMRKRENELAQSEEESKSQTEQIHETFDDAASGDVGIGLHSVTIVCYADNQEVLNKHVGLIAAKFLDLDIVCVREDVVSETKFWGQMPGNLDYLAREAEISTRNLASFVSLHNYASGKLNGNYWGDAVTVFETLSGSPYYFNFHYKDVGNFLVFGSMGSGKTVLIGFLILQSMKFGGKRIIFDKDRGLEILVCAMGGVYEIIRPGVKTGFNPCQLEDSAENRKFLMALFKKMLSVTGPPLNDHDFEVISSAIEGMYRLEKSERQLCHIASFFGTKRQGSLRARFDQWHSGGSFAWLFDNAIDSLSLNTDILGFDLGHILEDEYCKTPALMYLMYRVSKALEGNRGMLFVDEGWKAMDDEEFSDFINDSSRTPRKKNNFFGLATQSANDTASSKVSKAINESSFCKIFFPNPQADKKVYIDDFGLSEHEYELVKTLPDDQNYFLLLHGRSNNKQSVVIRANLTGLEDEVAVISGREQTLMLLDQIREEVGDDPSIWLPIFHEKRKQAGL